MLSKLNGVFFKCTRCELEERVPESPAHHLEALSTMGEGTTEERWRPDNGSGNLERVFGDDRD
ncbi:hypothetical protein RJ035_007098, partial [Blastomyces gilchristii]